MDVTENLTYENSNHQIAITINSADCPSNSFLDCFFLEANLRPLRLVNVFNRSVMVQDF